MRKLFSAVLLVLVSAWPAAAQLGRQIVVRTGTQEDKQITAIEAAKSPHQKLALLNQFAAAHPTGDMALMANELYVSVYSSLKNYRQAYAHGDKALAADPNNLNVAIQLIRDAQLQSDTERMVSYAVKVGQMVTRYKAQPPPAGTSAADWASQQQQTLASIQPDLTWAVHSTYTAISSEPSASTRAVLRSRMAKAFPKSTKASAQK